MPNHLEEDNIKFDSKYFKMDKMYNIKAHDVADADKSVPDFGYPQVKDIKIEKDYIIKNISITDNNTGNNFTEKEKISFINFLQFSDKQKVLEQSVTNIGHACICNYAVASTMLGAFSQDGGKYDNKGNSSHYQSQFMEFVLDQERKYGTIVAMIICQSNVDKYNQRAGLKEGVPAEKDLTKRDWYLKAFNHFKKKVEGDTEGRNSYVPVAEEIIDLFSNAEPKYVPLSIAIEKK
jgi:hypothetical protein